jgi:hypothetical protein
MYVAGAAAVLGGVAALAGLRDVARAVAGHRAGPQGKMTAGDGGGPDDGG